VQEVGSALEKTVRGAQPLTEIQETAVGNAAIRQVSAKIIEGSRLAIATCERDIHTRWCSSHVGFASRQFHAVLVEGDQGHVADGLAQACKKHVQERQRAGELTTAQLPLYMLGNKEAVAHYRAKGGTNVR